MAEDLFYQAVMGLWPKRIPNYEFWHCPDAETYITGIDHYEHPRLSRLRLRKLYPDLSVPVPLTDDPIPRPDADSDGTGVAFDEQGRRRVRWDDSYTWHWDWGKTFRTVDDVLAFSPLAQGDFSNLVVREAPRLLR